MFPKIKIQLERQILEDFKEIQAHLQAVLDSIVELTFVSQLSPGVGQKSPCQIHKLGREQL